jgi:hypothetical protein
MPHVIVKLWPGKCDAIAQNVWVEKVFRPDIKNNSKNLYKKPGYDENDL